MQKMLCPYCDHEIKGKGKCDFCGSRVSKPVIVETTAELNAEASANPNECDCNLHAPGAHPHDDTYRDSEDASYQADYERAYGADSAQGAAAQATNAQRATTQSADTYRAGTQNTGAQNGQGRVVSGAAAGGFMGTGAPRRAVLASEAVEREVASGTIKPGKTTGQKIGRIVLIVVLVNIVLELLFLALGLV